MKQVSVILAAVCIAVGMPISSSFAMAAQSSAQNAEAERETRALQWLRGREVCDKAREDERLNDVQRLDICETILKQMIERGEAPATRPRDGFERNFYWLGVSGMHTSIMGTLGSIDKVRSRRVCERALASVAAKSNVDLSQWPARYAAFLKPDSTQINLTAACKREFPALK